jgi:hypothetical protein
MCMNGVSSLLTYSFVTAALVVLNNSDFKVTFSGTTVSTNTTVPAVKMKFRHVAINRTFAKDDASYTTLTSQYGDVRANQNGYQDVNNGCWPLTICSFL